MHTPYVYRLTDRVTGVRYIGSRYAKVCEPADLGVKYFTTSKVVNPLFRANPDRFEKQIIVTGDADYVINVESALIELYDAVLSDEFYNRTNKKAVHPEDMKAGGFKCKAEKLGFHAFTKEQFSIHNTANGLNSFAERKGVHARTKKQMSEDGFKSYVLGVWVHGRTFEQMSETGRKNGLSAKHEKKGIFALTLEQQQELGKTYGGLSTKSRYKCGCCEMVTTAAGLGNHFRKSGHTGKLLVNF